MNTIRGNCPICKKPLLPTDDVVTCPDCGASYHRACYQKEGHCLYQDKHGNGFEYQGQKPDQPPPGFTPPPNAEKINCPNCGTLNDSRNIFCEKCGVPLRGENKQSFYGQNANTGQGPFSFAGNPMAPPVDLTGTIDDISVAEWTSYIGSSANVYVARMKQQDARKTKASFMFSAFFLGPFYFAYRKMWGWAILNFVLSLAFAIPSFLYNLVGTSSALVANLSVSALQNTSAIAYILGLAMNLLFGFFALYLYRKSSAKKIKKLRATTKSETEYQDQLIKVGGPSVLGVILVVVAILVLSAFLQKYLGDDLLQYSYALFG